MRKIVTAVAFGLFAMVAHAEASFDQIETLIQQKNYAAAESGLEGIIQNHPKSAKAFYAMAQAQAGLGNLEKAQKALNIATGLNPTLDFAPSDSVAKLKQAITPQTQKIEAVEDTHFLRNFGIALFLLAGGGLIIALIMQKKRKEEEAELSEKLAAQAARQEREAEARRMTREREEARGKETKVEQAKASIATEPKTDAPKYTASPAYSNPVPQPTYTPQPTHTTVVNNSNDGLLTGILIGDMLNHHHDTPRVVEREVIREVPASSRSTRDSSWDDTTIREERSSSRSSSWDSDSSSSSRSSSWDSSSSSSSSSSWSSSSSDSSSSWDSGSSSDSSSSWD